MLVGVQREVVLKLPGAVLEDVIGRERLEAERDVVQSGAVDVDEREERALRFAAFVIVGVAGDDLV